MVTTLLGRYLWVADRVANVAEVFEVASGARVNTVDLVGAASGDPVPDLADISPFGDRLFFSLRGPTPLSGDPHVTTGGTPGLGVLQLTQGGKSGVLTSVVRISNVDAEGVERADTHAIRVRLQYARAGASARVGQGARAVCRRRWSRDQPCSAGKHHHPADARLV